MHNCENDNVFHEKLKRNGIQLNRQPFSKKKKK